MIHTCSKCKREYDSEEKYNKHIKLNRCIEPYECKLCNYITKNKTDFNKHLNTKKCKLNSSKKFKCDKCNAIFRDNYNLQKHMNKKNPCSLNNTQNNSTINNYINNYNQQYNVVMIHCGISSKKKISDVDDHLINKLIASPDITNDKFINEFIKEEKLNMYEKKFSSGNKESYKKDNSMILTDFLGETIPRNPRLHDKIPIFHHDKLDTPLVKENNEIVPLDEDLLIKLLEKIKSLTTDFQNTLKNSPNDIDTEYINRYVSHKTIPLKQAIYELLFRLDNPFYCDKCSINFKSQDLFYHSL